MSYITPSEQGFLEGYLSKEAALAAGEGWGRRIKDFATDEGRTGTGAVASGLAGAGIGGALGAAIGGKNWAVPGAIFGALALAIADVKGFGIDEAFNWIKGHMAKGDLPQAAAGAGVPKDVVAAAAKASPQAVSMAETALKKNGITDDVVNNFRAQTATAPARPVGPLANTPLPKDRVASPPLPTPPTPSFATLPEAPIAKPDRTLIPTELDNEPSVVSKAPSAHQLQTAISAEDVAARQARAQAAKQQTRGLENSPAANAAREKVQAAADATLAGNKQSAKDAIEEWGSPAPGKAPAIRPTAAPKEQGKGFWKGIQDHAMSPWNPLAEGVDDADAQRALNSRKK